MHSWLFKSSVSIKIALLTNLDWIEYLIAVEAIAQSIESFFSIMILSVLVRSTKGLLFIHLHLDRNVKRCLVCFLICCMRAIIASCMCITWDNINTWVTIDYEAIRYAHIIWLLGRKRKITPALAVIQASYRLYLGAICISLWRHV